MVIGFTCVLPVGMATPPMPLSMEHDLNPIVSHKRVEEVSPLMIVAGEAMKLSMLDGGTFTVTVVLFSAANEPLSTMTFAVYVPFEGYVHVVLFVVADSPLYFASHGVVMFVPESARLQ